MAPRPIVFVTFGRMPDVSGRTRTVLQAGKAAGVSLVVQALGAPSSRTDEALVIPAALSYPSVFASVDAVLHHGGMGTTHEVCRGTAFVCRAAYGRSVLLGAAPGGLWAGTSPAAAHPAFDRDAGSASARTGPSADVSSSGPGLGSGPCVRKTGGRRATPACSAGRCRLGHHSPAGHPARFCRRCSAGAQS